MELQAVIVLCLFGASSAFIFSSGPVWNDLKVTWGLNPFKSYNSMPRTADDAVEQGFKKISDCNATTHWQGSRYIKDNDYLLVLLFDKHGYIAGVQSGIHEEKTLSYPSKGLVPHPFIKDGDYYFITSYFYDPSKICSTGRTALQFEEDGDGKDVYIQTGPNPATDFMKLHHRESSLKNTKWVKGGCFYTMGRHYWHDVHENSDCSSLFPVFALYNKGKLNAYGWVIEENLASKRAEHVPEIAYSRFLTPVPTCLKDHEHKISLSSLHIYLDSTPVFNFC